MVNLASVMPKKKKLTLQLSTVNEWQFADDLFDSVTSGESQQRLACQRPHGVRLSDGRLNHQQFE